jgi:uncharacterized protein
MSKSLNVWCLCCAVATVCCVANNYAPAAQIPPVPAEGGVGYFIHDYTGSLDATAVERITSAQRTAFEQHNTPIIVVTISRMSDYGHTGAIEPFAKEWFNKWQIGLTNLDGGGNQGALVLVSIGDRRARIELGGDWGRRWDAYCQRIMDRDMIPHFKQGDYGRGVAHAVESLALMAAIGPQGEPPGPSVGDRVEKSLRGNNEGIGQFSPFPIAVVWLALLVGIGLIVAAIFMPAHRKWMIIAGAATILVGTFTWVLVFLLLPAVMTRITKGGGGYSGGGYSGGGFSGGSSGGGGASGSW